MGLGSSKDVIKDAVKDAPQHLRQEKGGSVTVGYDPAKTPAENSKPTEKKPIIKNNPLINKYPDESVTMGINNK